MNIPQIQNRNSSSLNGKEFDDRIRNCLKDSPNGKCTYTKDHEELNQSVSLSGSLFSISCTILLSVNYSFEASVIVKITIRSETNSLVASNVYALYDIIRHCPCIQ